MIPFPFQVGQLGRRRASLAPAVFSYTGFLSGKVGDAWLADQTHYQDTARTTVANPNDPLGSITGIGAQFNAQQGTSGARPTLRESSGKRYFDFDGGDHATAGGNSNWNALHNSSGNAYACFAAQYGNSSNPDAIYALAGTFNASTGNVGWFFGFEDRAVVPANETVRLIVGKGTLGTAAIEIITANLTAAPQTDLIVEYVKSGTSVEIFVNGVSRGSGTLNSPSSANSLDGLRLGQANGNFSLLGRIYGAIVCNAVPNSTERSAIQADMSARCITPPI